ncbi:MAG: carboxylesterase family protein [Corynebacterium glucuronolyticum]|nr:carboxylesterase family protein [Mycobacteriaceae bacterium]MDY5834188.1 carboxylesterase family protein [Corynebacterium glucuronolyticum]
MSELQVSTPHGQAYGVTDGEVQYFESIRFGASPTPFGASAIVPTEGPVPQPDPESPPHELYLSVTAPAGGNLHPVIVFVHGGGFEEGTHIGSWYGASSAARDGIVTVSVDYRLGVQGFVPFTSDQPNHYRGIDDVNTALEWVQDTIEAFGGDPTNVTLSGQSAGGAIALWLARKDHYRGAFRRLWALSPAFPRHPVTLQEETIRRTVGGSLSAPHFDSLRHDDIARLTKKLHRASRLDLTFGPAPFRPEELVDIPLVIDTLENECYDMPPAPSFDRLPFTGKAIETLAPTLGLAAPEDYVSYQPKNRRMQQLMGDFIIRQHAVKTAEWAPQTTWLLSFHGRGADGEARAAKHCADLPIFFDSFGDNPEEEQQRIGADISATVAQIHPEVVRFATDGTVSWPAYGKDKRVLSVGLYSTEKDLVSDPFAHLITAFPQQ